MVVLNNDWDALLKDEFAKEYYQTLRRRLAAAYRTKTVYPDMYDIFNAFRYTPYHQVKVVILGQDPYHGKGQAHGLCFSVQKGVTPPPSLKNIFEELQNDVGFVIPPHGELTGWTKQGVLLLNTVLTVQEGMPNSHKEWGWTTFTDHVISLLNEREQPIVFLLWGANAKSKMKLLTNPNHRVFTAAHPSPLSAYHGFFGCKHFSKTNAFLQAHQMAPIDWQLELD